jgi:hypothetical protein
VATNLRRSGERRTRAPDYLERRIEGKKLTSNFSGISLITVPKIAEDAAEKVPTLEGEAAMLHP